jgi:hypothetical protein
MRKTLAILFAATSLVAVANASEMITNGGFETGDLSGWVSGAMSGSVHVNTPLAHSGKFSAYEQADNLNGSEAFLEQTITTTQVADISSFSVWLHTEGVAIQLDILDGKGGLFEYDRTFGDTGRGWVEWDLLSMIKGGGSLTQISQIDFQINGVDAGNNHSVLLDDASLQTQATPEPSTALLLAPAVAIFARRRSRR